VRKQDFVTETRKRTRLVMQDLKFRMTQVKRVEQLTPRMLRITLTGDDLADFETHSPDDHLKIMIPAPGQEKPDLPVPGEKGITFAEGAIPPQRRDFTPRRFDREALELDLEFVLHGHGPAATWAANAGPGSYLGLAGPRGSHVVDLDFDWYLLAGDETAIPFIARQLEELPAGSRAIALIEVADEQEIQDLNSPADVDLRWVSRNGAEAGSTKVLENALRDVTFLDGEFFTWIAGEANTLRDIRRYLLNERGVLREHAHFNGHWKYKVADWDHHEPIEE
jgi:NADPH-dependent ferric siderophore reductase